jgi:hypothetical protein
LAIQFLDLLSADDHAIDDEVYSGTESRSSRRPRSSSLGFACANTMGVHRFIHTLDVFGTASR